MDCSLPGSSVHGILQTVMLEWVAIPFSGDLLPAGIEPRSPTFQTFCTTEPPEKSMGPRSAFLAAGWNSAWFQLILAQKKKKKKKPSEVLMCLSWCFNGPDFSRGHLRRLLRTPWSHRCLYPRPPRPHCSLAGGEWVPPASSATSVSRVMSLRTFLEGAPFLALGPETSWSPTGSDSEAGPGPGPAWVRLGNQTGFLSTCSRAASTSRPPRGNWVSLQGRASKLTLLESNLELPWPQRRTFHLDNFCVGSPGGKGSQQSTRRNGQSENSFSSSSVSPDQG